MFLVEINFHDGISEPEIILLRRSSAIIGAGEYAHVVIEGSGAQLTEVEISRGIGRSFFCYALEEARHRRQLQFLEGEYVGQAELNLGDITTVITVLDYDLKVGQGEQVDEAQIRTLRNAFSSKFPDYPSLCVTGGVPVYSSIFENKPIVIGRARNADLRIDDPLVASQHLRVGHEQGRFWVEELDSAEAFINENKLSGKTFLNSNEKVRFSEKFLLTPLYSKDDSVAISVKKSDHKKASIQARFYPCLLSTSEYVRPSRFVLLRDQQIMIGRDPTNDIWIGAPHISRKHCEVRIDQAGNVFVKDISSNGTFYRGVELPREVEIELSPEDPVLDFGGEILLCFCQNDTDEKQFLNQKSREQDKSEKREAQNFKKDEDITYSNLEAFPDLEEEKHAHFPEKNISRNIHAASVSERASNRIGGLEDPAKAENYLLDPETEFRDDDFEPPLMGLLGKVLMTGLVVALLIIIVALCVTFFVHKPS